MAASPLDPWSDAMADGDFEAAWRISDRVLAARDPAGRDDPRRPYQDRWVWDGRPVEERRVLVRCYHGLGDTIQFSRFLPALRRRAAHVTLEVQPPLLDLLAAAEADRLVPFRPEAPLPPSECDVEIMELSHALRLAPGTAPYLAVDPPPRRAGLQVGLCWQVTTGWRPHRSVPAAALGALLATPGVTWHSLQRGAGDPLGLGEAPDALMDTARLVAGLDLVVTVDSMIAHLAGALGTPVWLLLDHEPDWRWRGGNHWYAAVRRFVQTRPGAWDEPLAEIAGTLAARSGC